MPETNKRRVLFITNGLRVGGSEKLLVEIVNRMDPARFEPTVISLDSDMPLASRISSGRADIRVFPRRGRYDFSPIPKIRRLLVEKDIEIAVPISPFDYFFSKISSFGLKRPPRIFIYIHSTMLPSRKWAFQDWLYLRLLDGREKFVSVCNVQADHWARTYRIPRARFTTIYGGVDLEYFDAALPCREIRQEFRIPPGAKVILQVASFQEHKSHEDAFRALKIVSQSLTHAPFLVLVGSGPKERQSKLMSLARELNLADRVIFCGIQADVRPYYIAADAFTLTSSSVETFPLSALEAMSMGLPCVLTDVGGTREMIVEGRNGFLVRPRDPASIAAGWLQALDPQKAFDKAQIRQGVAERFSITAMISAWEKILGGGVVAEAIC
jgi:glycosyltransferase involved in cell wall biosynthesis